MKNNRLSFLIILAVLLTSAGFVSAVVLDNPLGNRDFITIVTAIGTYIGGLIAGVAVIMFIWAGILFVTSAGNPGKIESAKKVVIYAIVGTGIALAATGLIELIKNIIGVV